MELTTQIVVDFLRLKAKIKQLVKLEKEMSVDIKEEMEFQKIEEFGPRDSQQVLYLSEYSQFDASYYKDMAEWAYKKLYGRSWKDTFEKHAEDGMRRIIALKNRVNPDYKPPRKKVA